MEHLHISERDIRCNGPGAYPRVFLRQRRTERALAKRGVRFRRTEPHEVEAAYSAMSADEFDAVNGRQNWGNWRTVPRCMSGLVPDRPLVIVDLGCGSGGSTRILAFYAPRGSRLLAYELARPLINVARDRLYLHRDGQPIDVEFICQGITEMLRGPDGEPLPDRSVDLANSSGVVGHHLDTRSLRTLAVELRRVLKHDGLAMLDSGRSLSAVEVIGVMRTEGFTPLRQRKSHWLDPYGQVVFQRSEER